MLSSFRKGLKKAGVVVAAAAMATVVMVQPASASIAQSAVVSPNPVDTTPHVLDTDTATGDVVDIVQIGNVMYFAGVIPKVANASKTKTYSCGNFFTYNLSTGAISCALKFDKPVSALAVSPDKKFVYIGGEFTTVNGSARRGLVKFDVASKSLVTSFKPSITGDVFDVQQVGSHVLIGGNFTKVSGLSRSAFASLSPSSGAVDSYADLKISGSVASNAGKTRVYRFAVNPTATRAVILGNFTSVGGVARQQAAMFNLGANATTSSWYSSRLNSLCSSSFGAYMRDVDFSPDGSYFVMASTGGQTSFPKLCDSASRWETSNVSSNAVPTWIDYTPADTLHSVSVTGAAVYLGGHQKQQNNYRYVNDKFVGSTPVDRPGIAALSPVDGKALSWNPTRDRGMGAKKLLATPSGLWVGSDTSKFYNETHGKIAFCPLP